MPIGTDDNNGKAVPRKLRYVGVKARAVQVERAFSDGNGRGLPTVVNHPPTVREVSLRIKDPIEEAVFGRKSWDSDGERIEPPFQ